MDESVWRQQRRDLVSRPCLFERALLIGCVTCHHASRLALAEREVVSCADSQAHEACADYLAMAAQRARFALHLQPGQPMAHAARMRIQCGGLRELARHSDAEPGLVPDVADTLTQAAERFGSGPDRWPWEPLVRAIRDASPRRGSREL